MKLTMISHQPQLRVISTRTSPSPLPSPLGRGRIVSRRRREPATGFAKGACEQAKGTNCYSLSPRERVRVRGNGMSKLQPSRTS